MVNLKNAKIYKIKSPQSNMIYIGATCKTLERRLSEHKSNYKIKTRRCSSYKLFELYDDNEITLIENFPCDYKTDLNRREGYWIKNTEFCINKNITGRTGQEHYLDNRTKILEYKGTKINCECGLSITRCKKRRHERTVIHNKLMEEII